MKRSIPFLVCLYVAAAGLWGCGDQPSTPIAPDKPKADPGPPKNIDQLMHQHDKGPSNGPKH